MRRASPWSATPTWTAHPDAVCFAERSDTARVSQRSSSPLCSGLKIRIGTAETMEQPPGTRAAVRISRIDLTGDERRLESIARTHLSAAERSRADRGTAEVRRRRILLRAALRQALGAELGSSPIDVPLVLDDDGR